jgi:hypothetical protein
MRTQLSVPRLAASLITALAVLGFAAACGGEAEETPAATGDPSAFTTCLREQGITLPDNFGVRPSGDARPTAFPTERARPTALPSGTARPSGQPRPSGTARPGGGFGGQLPEGVTAEQWQAALAKCGSLRPTGMPGGGPGGGPGSGPGDNGANAAYANCLSERGVTLVPGQEPATSDPKTVEALAACAPLKPAAAR